MASPFPLLLLGGAALLILGRKKKKLAKKAPEENGAPPARQPLPEPPIDEDLDEEDKGTPTPSPGGAPTPEEPTPPIPGEPSEPFGKPDLGPTGVGSCANFIYTRDPVYLTPEVTVANKALTLFNEPEYFFYIRPEAQKNIYNYMLDKFSKIKNEEERATVASVILREALKHFNSGCKWESPIDSLSKPEQLVWDGGRRLAIMAQITADVEEPNPNQLFQTGKRFTISRAALGETDPGFMGASKKPEPGRRVEVLATDKSYENAEHLIGEVVKLSGPNGEPNLFEIKIIDKFQGKDVAPRLRTKHGFKKGSNAFFSQQGPTGIYRIFPEGMV